MKKTITALLIATICSSISVRAEQSEEKGSVKYVSKATPTSYLKSAQGKKWQNAVIAIGVAAVAIATVVLVANNQSK